MPLSTPDSLRRDTRLMEAWRAMGEPPCHVTGGFLRDHLLGRRSTDLDLTVAGSTEQVAAPARRLARALGTRAHLLGQPPRSVWRIESDDLKVELWPLGSLTLDQDIQRRDFTCNALMWQLPAGPMVDRVGGVDDLAAERIRAISADNLRRDPVRLLRGARFLSTHESFELEKRTAGWIRELAPLLACAPRERVGQELLALLGGARPSRALSAVLELGLLAPCAPAGTKPDAGRLRRSLSAADRLASGMRHPIRSALRTAGDSARLALLLRAWHVSDPDLVSDYAWPRDQRRTAATAAALLDPAVEVVAAGTADRRELIHRAGTAFPAVVALATALDPRQDQLAAWRRWWRQWVRSGNALVEPPTLLPAIEIAAIAGVTPGPQLGEVLEMLRRAQVRGEVRSAAGARRWLRRSGGTSS